MEMKILSGENRERKNSSVRTYFYYVSPTGYESALSDAPVRKINQRKTENTSVRVVETNYSTESSFIMKMFTSRSEFGRPHSKQEIHIQILPEAELISITGLAGFGGFTGRAKLLTKLSAEELKTFSFEIKDKPISEAGVANGRKLIFKKRSK